MLVTLGAGRARVPLSAGLSRSGWLGVRFLHLVLLAGLGYQTILLVTGSNSSVGLHRAGYEITLTAAALLCLLRAGLVRVSRSAWLCFGISVALVAGGDIYRHVIGGRFPTLADAGFLASYPLMYAGLMLLFQDRARTFPASTWLDGLVAGLGLATVTAVVARGPLLSNDGAVSTTALAVGLAYPLADLTLLIMVGVLLVLVGARMERVWVSLAFGLGVIAVTDTVYFVQTTENTYRDGGWLDAFWLLAAAAIATAAWLSPSRIRTAHGSAWRGQVMPRIAAVAALLVLFYGDARDVSAVASTLAAATLLAVLARTSLSFRELRAAAETRDQALTDDLTGLGNRRLLLRRLTAVLARPDTEDSPGDGATLLLVDLDRFKEVNDALGHSTGDELLRHLGRRLADRLLPNETLARLGGDEFAVLAPGITDPDLAVGVADRIATALDLPVTVQNVDIHLSASIGIAIAPDHADAAEALLSKADVAMYQAKRAGVGQAVYSAVTDRNTPQRLRTAAELRKALDRGEVRCHYQPQVDLTTGAVLGVEALVRWMHPNRGLLLPLEFLHLAEHTSLMRPLTDAVLRTAAEDCRAWEASGLAINVSVNLAADTILDSDLLNRVETALAETGLPAGRLTVEITEGSLLGDPDRVKIVLQELRELGVEISIDDYGVGYSSLSYLQQLPVDELKLDRQLVTPVARDQRAAAIVGSTVDLAHALGVRLVAEGVEDLPSLRRLISLGCDRAQGYHVARPMEADALPAWVAMWGGAAAGRFGVNAAS